MSGQETVENRNTVHSIPVGVIACKTDGRQLSVRKNDLSSMTGLQIFVHDSELVCQCSQIPILVDKTMVEADLNKDQVIDMEEYK